MIRPVTAPGPSGSEVVSGHPEVRGSSSRRARSETEVSSRRTLILIGAIVIGGLAAFLTLNYVRGVENENAEKNQLVEVLVAKGPINKGTSADAALAADQISVDRRRRADLPQDVVTRDAEIADQVAAVNLGGGEIITSNMFVADKDLSGSKATSLDKGNVAVTISVEQAAGVAGLIQPGDLINIMATVSTDDGDVASKRPVEAPANGFELKSPAVMAFQNVKVLAIGQSLGEPVAKSEGEDAPAAAPTAFSGLITVQVPPADAVLLASIRSSALYLTLNRPDYEPVPLPYFNWVQIFSGELGVTPYDAAAAEAGQ